MRRGRRAKYMLRCIICGAFFLPKSWFKFNGDSKTCSKRCRYKLVGLRNFGKKKTEDQRRKISGINNHRFGKPAWNRKDHNYLPYFCDCGCMGICNYGKRYVNGHNPNGMLGKRHSEETKKKWDRKGQWIKLGLEKQNEITKRIRSSCAKEPNKSEMKLDSIIQLSVPNGFRYTGNGEVVIGGKAPDWFNINGKKQVIEHFGTYFHGKKITGRTKEQEEEFYKSHYYKYGYDCLVIWEYELKNIEEVTKKIVRFYDSCR